MEYPRRVFIFADRIYVKNIAYMQTTTNIENAKRERKSGIDKGLEDIRKGNVYYAENSEDLIRQIFG